MSMEKDFINAPIDNKHVLEDFTDVLHDGKYVERRDGKNVYQAFYDGRNLWEVKYTLGSNLVELLCRYYAADYPESAKRMRERLLSMEDKENNLYVKVIESINERFCAFFKHKIL